MLCCPYNFQRAARVKFFKCNSECIILPLKSLHCLSMVLRIKPRLLAVTLSFLPIPLHVHLSSLISSQTLPSFHFSDPRTCIPFPPKTLAPVCPSAWPAPGLSSSYPGNPTQPGSLRVTLYSITLGIYFIMLSSYIIILFVS